MKSIMESIFSPGYGAAWIIAESNGNLLQYRDATGTWQKPNEAIVAPSIFTIFHPDSAPELETIFNALPTLNTAVKKDDLLIVVSGANQKVHIEIMNLPVTEEPRYLILFQEHVKAAHATTSTEEKTDSSSTDKLNLLQFAIQQCQDQLADLSNYTDAIINTVSDLLLILDKDLKVVSATRPFYEVFKITEADIEGKYFNDLEACPWNNPELIEKLKESVISKVAFGHHEIACTFPSIGERVLVISCRHLEKINGDQLILVSIDDITVTRTEKNELVQLNTRLEERIKIAVEATGFGTWEIDPEHKTIIYDEQCRKLFGFEEGEKVDYESFREALLPEDRVYRDEVLQKTMNGYNDGIYDIQYRIVYKPTKEIRWIKSKGKVFFEADGKAKKLVGTMLDITKEKLAEQQLIESEERFRLAADAAAAMIWINGKDQKCYYYNKSWLHFTGNTLEAETAMDWTAGVHPDDLNKVKEVYNGHFNERKPFQIEFRMRRKDGQYRWVTTSGVPRFMADNIFEGYVGTSTDIHDVKMNTEELEQLVDQRTQSLTDAIAELEESNHNLEEFAYAASHDLQEPLRKIQTFASRLSDKAAEQLNEQTKIYLTKIKEAAVRMSNLIDALLNYSRLRNANEAWELTDLNLVVKNVLKDFDLAIQQKNGIVNLSALPVITAVPLRMTQLFHNLMSNAVKFARKDGPLLINISAAELTEEAFNDNPTLNKSLDYAAISFSDNGIGFNQDFAEKIFLIFQRLNGVSEYEGTGIGLAIARKIVLNHHGIINATSVEGEGTQFKIIFPVT
ncbi:MAG: PAS domain-containing protein [Chitinophagaceae bacterium]